MLDAIQNEFNSIPLDKKLQFLFEKERRVTDMLIANEMDELDHKLITNWIIGEENKL